MRPPRTLLLLFLALFPAGCATAIQTAPLSGMGATAQRGIAAALEQNLILDREFVEGKKVSLTVETAGAVPLSPAILSYARSILREEIERAGGEVVSGGALSISVSIDAAGIDATGRRLGLRVATNVSIPFWYSENIKGASHVVLVYRDAEGAPLRTVVNQAAVPHRDIYLFYFFGLSETP